MLPSCTIHLRHLLYAMYKFIFKIWRLNDSFESSPLLQEGQFCTAEELIRGYLDIIGRFSTVCFQAISLFLQLLMQIFRSNHSGG